MVKEVGIIPDRKPGDTAIRHAVGQPYQYDTVVNVEPLVVQKNRNVVRQQYDYSCGSAALTTVLDFYLGRNFQERQVMEGLLRFGETERIIERRGFSLLDMKRLVTALGHPSGGFKAQKKDLYNLDHPAIAPIEYAGFKHFVVIRAVHNGRVYIADPALGNITFTMSRFLEVWDNNVLFIVFPNGHKPQNALELREEDMRFVSDYIIAENSFKEFPHWQIRTEHNVANQIAQMQNNFRSSIVPKLKPNGEPDFKLGADGKTKNYLYELDPINDESHGLKQKDFNAIDFSKLGDDAPNEIEKTLRFKRK